MWNKNLRELVEQCVAEDPAIRSSMTHVIAVLEPMTMWNTHVPPFLLRLLRIVPVN